MSRLTLILAFFKILRTVTPSTCIWSKSYKRNRINIEHWILYIQINICFYLNVQLNLLDTYSHQLCRDIKDTGIDGRANVEECRLKMSMWSTFNVDENALLVQLSGRIVQRRSWFESVSQLEMIAFGTMLKNPLLVFTQPPESSSWGTFPDFIGLQKNWLALGGILSSRPAIFWLTKVGQVPASGHGDGLATY